jgi:outer membrane protein
MKRLFILLCCLSWIPLSAQDTLTLSTAISEALANNYGIRVARYNEQVAENNVYPGNADLLPSLSLNGTFNYNNNNSDVILLNADQSPGAPPTTELTVNGLQTYSAGANLGLNYTVFDGLGNVNAFRVLKATASQTQEQTRALVENTLAQVISAYYTVARLQSNVTILRTSVENSRERIDLARNQATFGSANQLAVLNAEVDLNTDSISLEANLLNLENAQRDLNFLLGLGLEVLYAVEQQVEVEAGLSLAELEAETLARNADLQAAEQGLQVTELNLRVAQAAQMPRLSINASYGYNFQDNGPVNFLQQLSSYGLTAGASLSFNVFNGLRTQRNIQNAELQVASTKAQLEQTEQQVSRDLYRAYANYRNNLRVYSLQQRSLRAAEANFARTQEAFRLGQATSIAFREAQLNLQRVRQQLNELRYDIKLSEVELNRLSGRLVQAE